MVVSYTGSGGGGYVPVAEAYEKGGYESRVSPYAAGAETVLRQGFLDLVENFKAGGKRNDQVTPKTHVGLPSDGNSRRVRTSSGGPHRSVRKEYEHCPGSTKQYVC